ncbi:lipoprotein LppF [Hyaloraphidium curvatum]|nr:lipoprotein LppF [Hyaloraphidium curvatum]
MVVHLFLLAIFLLDFAGIASAARLLDPSLPWHACNRERVDTLLLALGNTSARFDASRHPIAVLDWDNTVVRGDVADATLSYALRNGLLRPPPNGNWSSVSPYLTDKALYTLRAACPTSGALSGSACHSELWFAYKLGRTAVGHPAFHGWNRKQYNPAYAFAAQLLVGLTPGEVLALASAAREEALSVPSGSQSSVGGVLADAAVRYRPHMVDLVSALLSHGFDIWIVSASPQRVVETWAAPLGISPSRVVGIRNLLSPSGRYTADLELCGPEPGAITYADGKPCWIRQLLGPDARPALAAGDSAGDAGMLFMATDLRLVLDRGDPEVSCAARRNADGRWILEPSGDARKWGTIPCSTTGCADADGGRVPCRDEGGEVITDQRDGSAEPRARERQGIAAWAWAAAAGLLAAFILCIRAPSG